MTNVSKDALSSGQEQKLLQQFSNLFAQSDSKTVTSLFDEILTPSERIMFIKRVAIVLMLTENFSTYKIAKTLKVSDATVRSLRQRYKDKEFNSLLRMTDKPNFDHEKFWETMDVLLRLGMPPRGRGRWQYLYKSSK